MSIEAISYEGHLIECAPHCGSWGYRPAIELLQEWPTEKPFPSRIWSRMADRKAAAREVAELVAVQMRASNVAGQYDDMEAMHGHRAVGNQLAGLGLFLALMALVPA